MKSLLHAYVCTTGIDQFLNMGIFMIHDYFMAPSFNMQCQTDDVTSN